MDMSQTIIARSDQLNADDLGAGPRTIRITKVSGNEGNAEQPVNIFYEGDGGKPFRPCKTVRRVLVGAWGIDAKQYVGRSVTLYNDAKVKWGGMQVGGIRISHMSHIDRELTLVLNETKGKKAPTVIKPLATNGGMQAATTTQQKPATTIGFTAGDDIREFPFNLGGLEMYIEAFAATFQEATDKPAWFADNEKKFHELAIGAVGTRDKSARCEKLAARFDAVAAMIGEALADTAVTADTETSAETTTPPLPPIIHPLPIPQHPQGGNDWPAWKLAAEDVLRAATDPAWIAAWLEAHGEVIKAMGVAKKTWPGEIHRVAEMRVRELGAGGDEGVGR